jgi:hypothetical protein
MGAVLEGCTVGSCHRHGRCMYRNHPRCPAMTKADTDAIERALRGRDWHEPVPDDLQSEVRMQFNEALAGGPNMNGDAGPRLALHHALDCIAATRTIADLRNRVAVLKQLVFESLYHLRCDARAEAYHERATQALSTTHRDDA